jgi:hypothetical protein
MAESGLPSLAAVAHDEIGLPPVYFRTRPKVSLEPFRPHRMRWPMQLDADGLLSFKSHRFAAFLNLENPVKRLETGPSV